MTLRDSKTQESIDRFIDAFERLGVVKDAAEVANVDRRTVYQWQDANSYDFNTRFAIAQANHSDSLESRMFELIKGMEPKHNPTLLIFALNGAKPEKYRVNQVVSEDVAKDLMRELRAEQKKRRSLAVDQSKGMLPAGSDPEVPDGQG